MDHGIEHTWFETGAPPTRTTNNCDDQVERCDEPVPDRVSPKADGTMQHRVFFEEEFSCIEHNDGNWLELMVQCNFYLLKAKVLDGKADSMLLCAMEGVGMASFGGNQADRN